MPPLQQERVTFQSLAAGRPSFELDFVRVAAPEKTQVDNPGQTDVWAYMWGCSVLLAEVLYARVAHFEVAVKLHLLGPGVLEAIVGFDLGGSGKLSALPLHANAAGGGIEIGLGLAEGGVCLKKLQKCFVGRSHGSSGLPQSLSTRVAGGGPGRRC